MFSFTRRKPPYSQQEIAIQIGVIADLMTQRDTARQKGNKDEVFRSTEAIAVAQETLLFMMDKVKEQQK